MDPTRFDLLTRSLSRHAQSPSRRGVLQAIAAGLLTIGSGPFPVDVAGKRKKRRKRKRGHKSRPCLFGQRRCRDKRCHGCCGDADCGGNVCDNGTCTDCPAQERICRGGCIPETSCCLDAECSGGKTCIDGTCACRADQRLCEGACIPVQTCCDSADCGGAPCLNGRCQCPAGQKDCRGECIPETSCCRSSDCDPCEVCQDGNCVDTCPAGQECQDGQCRCPSGENLCRGDCIPETACCQTSDCAPCERCDDGVCRGGCPAGLECQNGECRCPSGEKLCDDACIPDDDCCTDADCGDLFLCAGGTCVVGQGICPTGAAACAVTSTTCGGPSCACFVSTNGQTRCGANSSLPGGTCHDCVNDRDCRQLHPDVPGVFCVRGGPECGCLSETETFCMAPCGIGG